MDPVEGPGLAELNRTIDDRLTRIAFSADEGLKACRARQRRPAKGSTKFMRYPNQRQQGILMHRVPAVGSDQRCDNDRKASSLGSKGRFPSVGESLQPEEG